MQESYLKVVPVSNLRGRRVLSPDHAHQETSFLRFAGYESADLIPPSFCEVKARPGFLNQRRPQAVSKHYVAEAIARPDHPLVFAFLGNNPLRNKFLLLRIICALNHPKVCNDAVDHNYYY